MSNDDRQIRSSRSEGWLARLIRLVNWDLDGGRVLQTHGLGIPVIASGEKASLIQVGLVPMIVGQDGAERSGSVRFGRADLHTMTSASCAMHSALPG